MCLVFRGSKENATLLDVMNNRGENLFTASRELVELVCVACSATTRGEAQLYLPGLALCSQGTSRRTNRGDGMKPRRLTGLDGLRA